MYEIYLERKAERDLKKLEVDIFTGSFQTLKPCPKIPSHLAVVKSLAPKMTGASE